MPTFRGLDTPLFRKLRWVLPGSALLAFALAGSLLWQTSDALDQSAREQFSESRAPFEVIAWQASGNATFHAIPAAMQFASVALGEDRVYLAGAGGIVIANRDGGTERILRPGLDLPPAPVLASARGLSLRSKGHAFYFGTGGEGLLILEGDPPALRLYQIRPELGALRQITAVLPVSNGTVILGTRDAGVWSFDGENFKPLHDSMESIPVTALAGEESSLWIGTRDQGVLHFRAGEVRRFSEHEGLPDRQVLDIARQGSSVFVGTPLGVAEFRGGEFHRTLGDGLFAQALFADERNLTVGTLDEGLFQVSRTTAGGGGLRRARSLGSGNSAPVVELVSAGGQQLALYPGGLSALELDPPAGGLIPLIESALSARNISALQVDGAGRLWVGYFDQGLDIVDVPRSASQPARHVEDEFVFCVNRIQHESATGVSVVATANGLVLFDPSGARREVLRTEHGLISNHVTDVLLDGDSMTVATPAGVTFFGPHGPESIYGFHGLVNNHVYALGKRSGRVLAGTLGGLSLVDGAAVTASYTTANSPIGHNWISAIETLGGDFYIGTYGAGVIRMGASEDWLTFPELPSGLEINPNAMLATATRLYAGSLGHGLWAFDPASERWTQFTRGLPSANVTALAAGGEYIYLGTDNGLVHFRESELGE